MEPDIRKDVRLLLFWGIRSHDSGECPNKGCLGKLLTHFVKLCFTSFNFNSAFLGGRCLAQFIVASLMEPDIRKDVRLLLFWGVRSHDSGGIREQGVFWEAPYPLRKAPLYFVQL